MTTEELRAQPATIGARPLSQVQLGDRVWTGNHRRSRLGGLREVLRLTSTTIVVQMGGTEHKYRRSTVGYFRRIGYGTECITGIATTEECAAWDAAVVEEAQAELARKNMETVREVRRALLAELFTHGDVTVHSFGESADTWQLSIRELTDSQVRQFAELANRILGKEDA